MLNYIQNQQHNVPNKADSIQIHQCHDYYKAITIADQKQSICTNNIINHNVVKLKECSTKGKGNMPYKYQIMKNSAFGKLSLNHTFPSEASFEHILIFILKGNWIVDLDKESLLKVHPLYKHFDKMLSWS